MPRLRAIDGGSRAQVAEPDGGERVRVLRGPCLVLNLAGSDGEALILGIGLALARRAGGVAYLEGVEPRAHALRMRAAQFAAAALARDGHAVAAWGRLCIGAGAASAASLLMPSLVVLGPDGRERDIRDPSLVIVGPDCDGALVGLLRGTTCELAAPLIAAVAGRRDDADLAVRLGIAERKAISRGLLPVTGVRRALDEVVAALEAQRGR